MQTSTDSSPALPPSAKGHAQIFWRYFWAGPWAFINSLLVMTGMAVWLPRGSAQVDNLVIPLVLFPLIWAVLFFYACLDRQLRRVMLVNLGLTGFHTVLLLWHFLTFQPA